MNDPALGFGSRTLQPLAPRAVQLLDLALNQHKTLSLALELRLQLHGQGASVPKREPIEPQRALDAEAYALRHQQGLYPKPMRKALALQPFQLPMQVPSVFFFDAGNAHHAPAAALAGVMANELREQALPVEPVGLHVTKPAAHFDTGSVHHLVLESRPRAFFIADFDLSGVLWQIRNKRFKSFARKAIRQIAGGNKSRYARAVRHISGFL